jgi:hypothetical protein
MSETIIGYARCSTDEQDLTAQRQRLAELGGDAERIYLDHGQASIKHSPRCDRATRSWYPSSTDSPAPYRTPAPSATR